MARHTGGKKKVINEQHWGEGKRNIKECYYNFMQIFLKVRWNGPFSKRNKYPKLRKEFFPKLVQKAGIK